MKILALTRYGRLGASSRLRTYQYIPYLQSRGWIVNVEPLLSDVYVRSLYEKVNRNYSNVFTGYFKRLKTLLGIRCYDIIWVEKELFPMLPAWFESWLGKLRVPYVVDYDDAVFHNYDLHPNWMVRKFLSNKIDNVMKNSALVIAGNKYLASRAVRAGAKRVEIIPTVIDTARYKPKYERNDLFTVGWIGTPVTAKYLKVVIPALLNIKRKHRFKLVLVGTDYCVFDDLEIETHQWAEDTEVSHIQSFDVGIMPLTDSPWERGKCGYKLIQYMACGKPVVASPVGINNEIVEDGVNGFLAKNTEEWTNALEKLMADPNLAIDFGKRNRAKVEENYCIQITGPKIEALFRSVFGV